MILILIMNTTAKFQITGICCFFFFYSHIFCICRKILILNCFFYNYILKYDINWGDVEIMLLCVDREDIKTLYEEFFNNFSGEQNNLMYLTGIPGIGKSILIEYIHSQVKEKFPDMLNVLINLNFDGNYFSFFNNAYLKLRQQGVKFYSYELALDYLYKFTGDKKYQISHEHNTLFFDFAELSFEFIQEPIYKVIAGGSVNLLSIISAKLSQLYKDYLISQSKEISETKHEDVIANLGRYFIRDINRYCEENNANICYFIDTFEKCNEKIGFLEKEFIETFVLSSKYSFWLIGGTTEIPLDKYKDNFAYFSSVHIDNFDDEKYIREILNKQYEITDENIINTIFTISKGYPASVELIAETYINLKKLSDKTALSQLFTETKQADFYHKFFKKYYRKHVIADDLNVLAFLACFDSWTYKEYEYYAFLENIGNPKIKFEKLKKHVIVKDNLDGSFFILDVARKCLLNADKDITIHIYKQAFDYLLAEIERITEEKINEKNSGDIHLQVISAIRIGAKILKEEPTFANKYYDWFVKFEQSLSPKMLYQLKSESIACFIRETKKFLEKANKDDIHSNMVLQCLYDYAWTYCYQRNYKKAIEIIKKYELYAQRFIKNTADERIVKARYTRAVILENHGEYDEALMLHKEILKIRRNGADKRVIGVSLNCIGFLYMLMNDFTNAKNYFDESLIYRSIENDLRGFCTVHANLSKMYFLQAVHTNDSIYLHKAKTELDIALANLSEESVPALYKSWKIRNVVLQAQMLRFSKEASIESYEKILSELMSFIDIIEDNPQFGMFNHIMTTKNNIAVIYALMEDSDNAYETIVKCLADKELFYDIKTNPKNKPCSISRKNLEAIKENRLHDLIFEY